MSANDQGSSAGDETPPTVEGILGKIENSPYGELLRDETKLEAKLIELMENSPDRTLAEMGRELRTGAVSWQGLAEIPGYTDVLQTGFQKMQDIDLAQVADELDDALAEGQAEQPVAPDSDPNAAGDDDFSDHRYLG